MLDKLSIGSPFEESSPYSLPPMVNNSEFPGLARGLDFSNKKIWQNYSSSSDDDSSQERADQIENNEFSGISENHRS
jgi:hypothetical protein